MCNPVMNNYIYKPLVPATTIAPPFVFAELSMKVIFALSFIFNVDDHRAMAPAVSAEF